MNTMLNVTLCNVAVKTSLRCLGTVAVVGKGTKANKWSTLPRLLSNPVSARIFSSARDKASQHYTFALTRQLPNSFPRAISKFSEHVEPVSMSKSLSEHENYLTKLRLIVPTLCLPALEEHPDSVFVEDTVVAINKQAVLTHPGHPSRQGEVESIKDALLQLGMTVTDMRRQDPTVTCDGGDVLYTGRHLFVGLSERTSLGSVDVFREAFGMDQEVIGVPVVDSALHLKSVVTHLDEYTLVAPTGKMGDEILQAMKAQELGYTAIRVPDVLAANVVSINGHILAQDTKCDESRRILQEATTARNLQLQFVCSSEMAKCDAALTCCSVLLSL
jgi:dimethylargininase